MFKNAMKSTTVWGIVSMVAAFAPGGVTDPLWALLTKAGLPETWVAIAQTVVFLAGTFVALRGRVKAKGPLDIVG